MTFTATLWPTQGLKLITAVIFGNLFDVAASSGPLRLRTESSTVKFLSSEPASGITPESSSAITFALS